MTSIPSSSVGGAGPGGEATGAAPTGGEGGSAENGGFMALINALLQATAPVGAAVIPDAQIAAGDAGGDADDEPADADALLAALGMLPPPAVPLPRPVAPADGGFAASRGATAALAAGQQAGGDAAAALAEEALLGSIDEAAAADGGFASADGAPATADADGGTSPWAAASGRVAAGQDVARNAAAAAEGVLREPVGTPRWRDELGAQLTMMAAQGRQSGSLRLSPEHLGPLEIQIDVAGDRSTTVQFGAQNADTRAALQEALPRLREMFDAAGLHLADAGVSGDAPRPRPEDRPPATADRSPAGDGEPSRVAAPVRAVTHRGLLDTYA